MIHANGIWSLEGELAADIEWIRGGNLRLADDETTASRYEAWAKIGAEHGLGTRILGMKEIAELLPGINRKWTAGIFTPGGGQADPVKATRAMAHAAKRMGAVVLEGRTVSQLVADGGRMTGVNTDVGEVPAHAVVLAAGAWSSRLAATASTRT
jgi:glycine/D-amino acid oxidase-like deaminating enzyme